MYVKRQVHVACELSKAFLYVSHFENLYEWDNNVIQGERQDLGPIQLGSEFKFLYSLFGRRQNLLYKITEIKENEKITLSCEGENFTAVDVISFAQSGVGVSVTYEATITLGSALSDKLFTPIMAKIADGVVARLKNVLEFKNDPKEPSTLTPLKVPYRFTSLGWNDARKRFCALMPAHKKILITGPTSGLGLSAANNLAAKGCDLVLVARSKEKLAKLTQNFKDRNFKGELASYICDMENLPQVQQTCEQILTDGHKLHCLVNNAGALFETAKSVDGIERSTVVDFIAPAIFTHKLIPNLAEQKGCVINVSSGGMYSAKLNMGHLTKAPEPFSGAKAYAQAKRAMMILTRGLNEQWQPKGAKLHCMHPGWADTPGFMDSLPTFYKMTKKYQRTTFQGADTIVWLALENPEEGGKFWLDRRIQPEHIIESTVGKSEEFSELCQFLTPFTS